MSANLKPPNSAARAMLRKLQALAERGIDGEKTSAQRKIARLKARFDFSVPDPTETPDLFHGSFKRSTTARPIYSFGQNEFDVASSVKWAIETATGISCVYHGTELLAVATPGTIKRLTKIATYIAQSFRALLDKFVAIEGVRASDRTVFIMGLYDGMMNEVRNVGQRLPGHIRPAKTRKGKKLAMSASAHLGVHPYSLALSLGKQIRFSAPVEEITAELDAVAQKLVSSGTSLR